MRMLSFDECRAWCESRGVDATNARRLRLRQQTDQTEVVLPSVGLKIVAFSLVLGRILEGGRPTGILLWLTEKGMWSEEFEALGSAFWDRLLSGCGVNDQTEREKPGLLFTRVETQDLRLFLTCVTLFQWDASLIDGDGRKVIHISHDGYVRMSARDRDSAKDLKAIASAWGSGTSET